VKAGVADSFMEVYELVERSEVEQTSVDDVLGDH
jgi:DNA-binding ferritin-like protein (Dps family)